MHLNIAQMKTNKLQIYAFVVNIYKKSHFSNNNAIKIQVLLCYKLAMVYLLSVVDIYVWVTPVLVVVIIVESTLGEITLSKILHSFIWAYHFVRRQQMIT